MLESPWIITDWLARPECWFLAHWKHWEIRISSFSATHQKSFQEPANFLYILGFTCQAGLQSHPEEAWSINDHPQTAPYTDPNAPKLQQQQEKQYTNSPWLQKKCLNINYTHFNKTNSSTKSSILIPQYHHLTHFLSLQHNNMNNYGGIPQLIMSKSSCSESWNSYLC